jgi:hypothetical protein
VKNENTTYQNLWDIGKAMLNRQFIAMSAYLRKIDTSPRNNQMMHI